MGGTRACCAAMKLRLLFALMLLALAGIAPASAQQREHVIVSGGVSLFQWEKFKAEPHDRWWLNFIRAARIRIQQLRESDPNTRITWMVYAPAYRRRMVEEPVDAFGIIGSVRDAYGVRLIYFDKGTDVVDYLNQGQPRNRVKVASFEYFGHSNKACFMFDYSNEIDSGSKAWLHENELSRIRRGVFAPGATAKSWGCHTGESMSKKWRQATGIRMEGAIGKTQYLTHELPALSSVGGRWAR